MSFFRSFVSQLFIAVIIDKEKIKLQAKAYKKRKITDKYEKSFEDKKKLAAYLQELVMNYQIYYVSLLATTLGQGLLPVGNPRLVSKFQVDFYSVTSMSLGKYLLYIDTKELKKAEDDFSHSIDLNTLYSPFAILDFLIKRKKITKTTLCVYKYSTYLSVAVYDSTGAKFGAFFHILLESEEELDNEQFEEIDEVADEGDENENMESLELKTLDEAVEQSPDLETELAKEDEVELDEDLSSFTQDMKMSEYIIEALKEFYENEVYDSNFIEDALIFSEEKISKTALQFLESELFIKPRTELCDTINIMQKIMMRELA